MSQRNDLLNLLSQFDHTDLPDSWECNLDPSILFIVSSLIRKIDSVYLLTQDDQIRWNKDLPIKVNIHSWHRKFDRLPTRFNLDMRGIDLHSTRCHVCDGAIETTTISLSSVKLLLIFLIRLRFGGV